MDGGREAFYFAQTSPPQGGGKEIMFMFHILTSCLIYLHTQEEGVFFGFFLYKIKFLLYN